MWRKAVSSLHSPTRAASDTFGVPRGKGQTQLWTNTASWGLWGWWQLFLLVWYPQCPWAHNLRRLVCFESRLE